MELLDAPLPELRAAARRVRQETRGGVVTYSPKVFIPLTQLCRDVCHYCTFAKPPRRVGQPFMSVDEAVATAAAGAQRGCKEALFTLGEKPELRYNVAKSWLAQAGFPTTLHYLAQ